MVQQLPNSLLHLIEHVELNRSGWWDIALGNVLLAAVWTHGGPIHRGQVRDLVASAFSLQVPPDRINAGIDSLLDEGKLVAHANDHIFLAAGVADQLKTRLDAARSNEARVRSTFVTKVGDCCTPHTAEEAWDLFRRQYLLLLIEVLGARTLQFMGGHETGDEDVAFLTNEFIGLFDPMNREDLRSAISDFLDPQDENVRRYVTEHLDASFLVKASGLTNEAIAAIANFGRHLPTFCFFLDTNFLFSLLDIHENPSNEAVQMLGKTIQQVENHIDITMLVIHPTMDEIKRTLSAFRYDLEDLYLSPGLADAALTIGLSGVAMRYARAYKEAAQPITPNEYFDPYLNNLSIILRSKDIEVCDQATEAYKERLDVIDDLVEMAGVEDVPEAQKQGRYNAALHDSILWHFVHDRRPSQLETPLDAVSWLVTVDYRLLRFDRRRKSATNAAVGVCIHPTELVQILRIWEPRSTDMEQALMSGLRLPFMFYEFDLGRESASMRILKILSRFEQIDYLKPDAIRDIVLNDTVRSLTTEATSDDEAVAVIRDALLAEQQNVANERDTAISRAQIAEEALASERQLAQEYAAVEKSERERAETLISKLEADLQSERDSNRGMSERLQSLEGLLDAMSGQSLRRSAIVRAVLTRGIGGGLGVAAIAITLAYLWTANTAASWWAISLTMLAIWLAIWFLVITTRVQDAHVRQWAPMRTLLAVRRFVWWILGPLLVTIIGNAIWQEVIQPLVFG